MARSLAYLFGCGATLALSGVLLPHPADTNVVGLTVVCLQAYLVAAVLLWRSELLGRTWIMETTLGWGSVSIFAVSYFSAQSPSPLGFIYIFVAFYASYFLTPRHAVLQLGLVSLTWGLLLALRPPDAALVWWVVLVGSLAVTGGLVMWLRRHLDELIARLHDAARTDPLTGLVNRRGFREHLDLELARVRRRPDTKLAVVVADLDRFKEVNDRFGHPAGDAFLKRFAAVVFEAKREGDVAARVGGEEFALLLPDVDADGAYALAERIRACVREEFSEDSVALTVSLGVVGYPGEAQTAGALLQAADEAMYVAKEQGRDRTVAHSPSVHDLTAARSGRDHAHGEAYLGSVLDLSEALDFRLSGSARHSETVGRYAEAMARELGLSPERSKRVRLAGVLHDVGKVGVPDEILQKAGPLSDEEWNEIQKHPELGERILGHPDLVDLRRWVGAHHERMDGTGYPRGLPAGRVEIEARIICVADAYEAMTSDRVYRGSIGPDHARDELLRGGDTQFDLEVVKAFLAVLASEAAVAASIPA